MPERRQRQTRSRAQRRPSPAARGTGKSAAGKSAAAPVETQLDFEIGRAPAAETLKERFLKAKRIFLTEKLASIQGEIDERRLSQDMGFLLMILYTFNFIKNQAGPEHAAGIIGSLSFTGWPFDLYLPLLEEPSLERMAAAAAAIDARVSGREGMSAADVKTLLVDAWDSFGLSAGFASREEELARETKRLYSEIGGAADRQRRALVDGLIEKGGRRLPLDLHNIGIIPTELCPNNCRFCLAPWKAPLAGRTGGQAPGISAYVGEVAAFAASRGLTITITGGEPLLELQRVTQIIRAAPGRVELTTSCRWANSDAETREVLEAVCRAADGRKTATTGFDFILQLSIDAFHQEVRRTGTGELEENVPLGNVLRVVETAQSRFPGLKLALLPKFTRYPDPLVRLLKKLESDGWLWEFIDKCFDPGVTVSAGDSDGAVQARPALQKAWLQLKPPAVQAAAAGDGEPAPARPLPVFILYGQVESIGRAALLEPFEFPTHRARTEAFVDGGHRGERFAVTGLEVGDDGNVYPEAYCVQSWSLGNLGEESLKDICARAEHDPLLIALAEDPARIKDAALDIDPGLKARMERASSPMALVYGLLADPELRLEITRRLI